MDVFCGCFKTTRMHAQVFLGYLLGLFHFQSHLWSLGLISHPLIYSYYRVKHFGHYQSYGVAMYP